MSELVALNFDADASPSVRFESPDPSETTAGAGEPTAIYGWGVGWYPSSERGASVIKDPTSSGERTVSDAIGDWNRFRSTTFICHLRGHQRPRKQEDAQPFVRSYGGRQWIFAHDGDLAADWSTRFPLPDDPSFDPLGRTDSEHALCLLLSRMHALRIRSLADADPNQLCSWLHELSFAGRLNVLLADGQHLLAFRDPTGGGDLFWTRRVPPHQVGELVSPAVRISMDSPEDPNRTQLVFSSIPLTDEEWQPVLPGQLILARRGAVVWSSSPLATTSVRGSNAGLQDNVPSSSRVEAGHQVAAAQPIPEPVEAPRSAPTPVASRTLKVFHQTKYQYEKPVEQSSHRILLRPLEDRVQELLEHSLKIGLVVDSAEYEDVFGNAAISADITGPYRELDVVCESVVRVDAVPPLERRAVKGRRTIPLVWMPWQRQLLSAYLMPPELPETQLQELSDYAMTFVERNDYDLVGTLVDINSTIYKDFEYVSGSTTNTTTAFQVFESRRGVCQDFANLMICMARLLQVPARYRMGYIFTGADYENTIQSEASHAWVELYIPRVGWHGFDPTNGIQVGADHIRIACGRSYLDATPLTGTIYRGGGTETLTVTVRVEEVKNATQSQAQTSS